ncbi:MAG: hypothetical protein KFKLKKLM_02453 [Flavobacteriales bacterium]|nr:hypothetical protein [Flavobacteriales bacterium]
MEPIKRISKQVVGTSPTGVEELLIQVDSVETHEEQSSDYNCYVRVTVLNQSKQDTFIFDSDDFKVKFNFLQTGDEELRLLEKYMMLLQDQTTLSNFIEQIAKQYFGADLNYTNIQMKKGAD